MGILTGIIPTSNTSTFRFTICQAEEHFERRTEVACDTGWTSGSEIVVVPILLFSAILMQGGRASHCILAAS